MLVRYSHSSFFDLSSSPLLEFPDSSSVVETPDAMLVDSLVSSEMLLLFVSDDVVIFNCADAFLALCKPAEEESVMESIKLKVSVKHEH